MTVELIFAPDIVAFLFSLGIGLLPSILAYTLILKAANIEWERFEYAKLFMFIGLINIIYQFAIFFIPNITGTNPTEAEIEGMKGYVLGISLIQLIVPILLFGIPIILIGIKNNRKYEAESLIAAGLLFVLSKLFFFIAYGVIKIQVDFHNISKSYMGNFVIIAIIVTFLAYICLVWFGLKMKNRHITIAGILFICSTIGFIPYDPEIISLSIIWVLLIGYIMGLHIIIIREFGDRLTDMELTLSETKKKMAQLTGGTSVAKKAPKKKPAKKRAPKKQPPKEE
jgi:uncharacterized membrane protein